VLPDVVRQCERRYGQPEPARSGVRCGPGARPAGVGDAYDAIFPEDDPGSAAFSSPSAEDAFNNQGRSLARGVKHAVGDRYEVTYWDRRDQAWLRVPGDGG